MFGAYPIVGEDVDVVLRLVHGHVRVNGATRVHHFLSVLEGRAGAGNQSLEEKKNQW